MVDAMISRVLPIVLVVHLVTVCDSVACTMHYGNNIEDIHDKYIFASCARCKGKTRETCKAAYEDDNCRNENSVVVISTTSQSSLGLNIYFFMQTLR
jgi:hypothetical protein